jgi:hypothetical protein
MVDLSVVVLGAAIFWVVFKFKWPGQSKAADATALTPYLAYYRQTGVDVPMGMSWQDELERRGLSRSSLPVFSTTDSDQNVRTMAQLRYLMDVTPDNPQADVVPGPDHSDPPISGQDYFRGPDGDDV